MSESHKPPRHETVVAQGEVLNRFMLNRLIEYEFKDAIYLARPEHKERTIKELFRVAKALGFEIDRKKFEDPKYQAHETPFRYRRRVDSNLLTVLLVNNIVSAIYKDDGEPDVNTVKKFLQAIKRELYINTDRFEIFYTPQETEKSIRRIVEYNGKEFDIEVDIRLLKKLIRTYCVGERLPYSGGRYDEELSDEFIRKLEFNFTSQEEPQQDAAAKRKLMDFLKDLVSRKDKPTILEIDKIFKIKTHAHFLETQILVDLQNAIDTMSTDNNPIRTTVHRYETEENPEKLIQNRIDQVIQVITVILGNLSAFNRLRDKQIATNDPGSAAKLMQFIIDAIRNTHPVFDMSAVIVKKVS